MSSLPSPALNTALSRALEIYGAQDSMTNASARQHLKKEHDLYLSSKSRKRVLSSGGSRGGKSGHGPPHRSWQWSLAPLGGRKSNDSIVNLPKSNDFGPPRIAVGYGFGGPSYEKIPHYNIKKVD